MNETCPKCGSPVETRAALIAQGEKFGVGYKPANEVYAWLLRAILFLLKERA